MVLHCTVEKCDSVFQSELALQIHLREHPQWHMLKIFIHQTALKKFKCTLCTYAGFKPGQLNANIKYVHSITDEGIVCKYCGRRFFF